jgi:hypothetical protein
MHALWIVADKVFLEKEVERGQITEEQQWLLLESGLALQKLRTEDSIPAVAVGGVYACMRTHV